MLSVYQAGAGLNVPALVRGRQGWRGLFITLVARPHCVDDVLGLQTATPEVAGARGTKRGAGWHANSLERRLQLVLTGTHVRIIDAVLLVDFASSVGNKAVCALPQLARKPLTHPSPRLHTAKHRPATMPYPHTHNQKPRAAHPLTW